MLRLILLVLVVNSAVLQLALCFYDEAKFREICRNDNTNDDAIYLTSEELIVRSGYQYEDYYSIAADGYVTQILHLINPKANQSALRKPPVLLFHGALIDTSAYLAASSIQHHPETYPRSFEINGIITSSNRSLAFTLCNNGFDVWLITTRGANRASRFYIKDNPNAVREAAGTSFRPNASMYEYSLTSEYWYYGQDDIVAYELKYQIDLVLNLTGSQEFIYLTYSLSTPTSLAFLAENPDYARRVRLYVQFAPAIAASHFTAFSSLFWENLVPQMPTRGIGFLPSYALEPLLRQVFIQGSRSVDLRYSLIFEITRLIFGPAPIYQTNLERNVLSRILQSTCFKQIQHYGINSVSRQLTKFDYSIAKNIQLYGQVDPPRRNVNCIAVQNWTIVSGSLDVLADPQTVQRLIESIDCLEINHIIAPGFNHLDIIAAVENALYVNLPLVRLFISVSD